MKSQLRMNLINFSQMQGQRWLAKLLNDALIKKNTFEEPIQESQYKQISTYEFKKCRI